jgi:Fe-S cluster assembly protein SufD
MGHASTISKSADSADAALVALNTALVRDRTLIRATGRIEQPLEIICVAGRSGLAAQVRLRFELAAGARLTAVQRFVDLGTPGSGWLNQVIDAELGAGSELSLYRIQQFGAERTLTSLLRAELADRAQFRAAAVELGAGLSRNELQIALSGEAAVAEFRGLALTRARQHCDTRIDVDHRAPRTRSRQDYRAIAADRSRSVFNGKVTVREGAQHIDARQRNDNLLLTATAEIDTKPELEIYADQVVCSHGATVGELSEQHLFYLQSRGIAADAARAILTTAFADVILRDFGHDGVREQARAAVAAVLPHCLGRE